MEENPGAPGLQILTADSLHVLADRLAAALQERPLPPLRDETVIVPSQGMARWLQLELARRLGCAAGLWLPFPAAFCQEIAGGAAADRDALTFALFSLLASAARDRRLAEPARYLQDDPDQRKRYQLARRLAACFDDYQLYREDLLAEFEREPPRRDPARWQAHLWRQLNGSSGSDPAGGSGGPAQQELPFTATGERQSLPGSRLQALRELLRDPAAAARALPPRLSVFGASTLPPAFVELLAGIGEHVPVHLYLLQPGAGDGLAHPLCQKLGRQAADFEAVLQQCAPGARRTRLPAEAPSRSAANLLHALQADLRAGAPPAERRELRAGDDSLQIHVCHSPLREMEVLRDRILHALEQDPGLQPHDILVLVPDIAAYAPYIEATFREPGIDLPFRVADRGLQAEEPLVAALLRVLELAGSRISAPEVLHLLETDSVRARFGIQRSQLPALQGWVERARIRWGIDGEDRAERFGVPPLPENTWRQGLRRLLLGHGTGRTDELVAGLFPCGEATDTNADLLGAFAEFTAVLFGLCRELARPHRLRQWSRLLFRLLDALFLPASDADRAGLDAARAGIARLDEMADRIDLDEAVTPAVLREHLRQSFLTASHPHVFLGGGLTFAALKPMRTIPVRMLCLAGLHDEAFPRQDHPAPFDLIALQPRLGDRSVKADDRQLFLECLLAAGDRLAITYVGRSQKDDSERAPSIVLEELLDHLEDHWQPPQGSTVREAVTVVHPLQAFSRRYFDGSDPDLFSYAAQNCPRPATGAALFAPEPLPAPEGPQPEVLELADLVEFWRDPSRFFCQRVLDLWLPRPDDRADDAEPFALHGLDKYRLQQELCDRLLDEEAGIPDPEVLRQQGVLPPADLGRQLHLRAETEARAFVARLPARPGRGRHEALVQGDGFLLHGIADHLDEAWRVVWRHANVKPKDRLGAWIAHLFLNAAAGTDPGLPRKTLLLAKDAQIRWPAVEDPLPLLARLVTGFRLGQRQPLPFFEYASYEYAKSLHGQGGRRRKSPWTAAAAGWQGGDRKSGDADNPYAVLCARDRDLFGGKDSEFATWAKVVWLPVLERKA